MLRYAKLLTSMVLGSLVAGGCSARNTDDQGPSNVSAVAELQLQGVGISADINVYPGGNSYRVDVVVKNTGTKVTTNWEVDVELNNSTFTSSSQANATVTQSGTIITLRPLASSNNFVIPVNGTTYPSFSGSWPSSVHQNPVIKAVRRDVSSNASGGASSGGSSNRGGSATVSLVEVPSGAARGERLRVVVQFVEVLAGPLRADLRLEADQVAIVQVERRRTVALVVMSPDSAVLLPVV